MPETSLQLQSYCGGDGGGGRRAGTPQVPSVVTPLFLHKRLYILPSFRKKLAVFIANVFWNIHFLRIVKIWKKSENSENMIKKWMFRKKFVVESDNYFSKWRRDIKSLV